MTVLAVSATLMLAGCATPVSSSPGPAGAEPAGAVEAPAPQPAPAPTRPSESSADAHAGAAIAVLQTLPVKGRAPKTGYDREVFGPAWADTDGNGCDTRNDILRRDLTDSTTDADGCTVRTGWLADPYSRDWVWFVRGVDTSEAVQVDHVVALSDAWQKGAQQLDADERAAFANDPLNLLAVDGALNQQKGDGDAATWLPPNKGVRCEYVARQVAVKHRYDLWVTAAEQQAITRILTSCPGQPLPSGTDGITVVPDEPRPAPDSPAAAEQPVAGGYRSCTEARGAGAAPLRRGEQGYAAHLDGDGDGVACE